MPDASPMDSAEIEGMPEHVRGIVVEAREYVRQHPRATHEVPHTIVWLDNALRTALADTRRVDWLEEIKEGVVYTDDGSGMHLSFMVSTTRDDCVRYVIDAAMAATPREE